jgi:spore coat protein U-like protein
MQATGKLADGQVTRDALKRVLRVAISLSLVAACQPALAATCSISAPTLNFGAYDPLSAAPTDSSTNILVTCNRTVTTGSESVTYTLSLSSGSGSFASRTMLKGTAPLAYNLHTSSQRDNSTIWGDGTGGSTTISSTLPPLTVGIPTQTANHPIYGRIPARQDVPIGAYSANVVLTINY